jgi:hypothetical protein
MNELYNLSPDEYVKACKYYEWLACYMLKYVEGLRKKYPERSVTMLCHPMAGDVVTNLKKMIDLILFFTIYTDTVIPNQIPYNAMLLEEDPGCFPLKMRVFYRVFMAVCDQVLMVEGYEKSVGCMQEVVIARELGKPVYLYSPGREVALLPELVQLPQSMSSDPSNLYDFSGERTTHHGIEPPQLVPWRTYVKALP